MFLIGFFSGIGITLFTLFFFFLLVNIKQKKILKRDDTAKIDVEQDEILELIKRKRELILKSKSFGFSKNYDRVSQSLVDITEEVSKKYFPSSKYSKYELTIEESLILNIDISKRLLEQLSKKRYKLLRELRISQILYINDAKRNILENTYVQKLNKYKVVDIIKNGWMIYNIANPVYWAKRLAFAGGIEAAIRSFGVIIINTVGEEVNKVYSKSFKDMKKVIEEQKVLSYEKKDKKSIFKKMNKLSKK